MTYPIISSHTAKKNFGVSGFPTVFIVDAKGKVSNGQIETLLKDCDMPPVAEYSKKFDAARKAIDQHDFKTAATELWKLEAKGEGDEVEHAKGLLKWIEDHGAKRIAEGDAAKETGDVFGAKEAYTEVTKRWSLKAECHKAAKEKLSELSKDKDAKKAFAQEKLWQQAQALEEAGDKPNARGCYEKLAKATHGTKFGDLCEKKVEALR